MTRYSADALNGLIGRMVKVEFIDGSVATGLLSATHPYYGTPREGKWILALLDGGVYIFWQSHVKAVTVARTGRRVPKGWGRTIKEDEK